MDFSTDERHAVTLDFLDEVRGYLTRLPAHPMHRDMIRRIEGHLADPTHRLAQRALKTRAGGSYTPAGRVVLELTAEGDEVTVKIPPKGKNGIPEEALLRRLRRGERISLKIAS